MVLAFSIFNFQLFNCFRLGVDLSIGGVCDFEFKVMPKARKKRIKKKKLKKVVNLFNLRPLNYDFFFFFFF